jgi:hypothetical protein
MNHALIQELKDAEYKPIDSLSRYKFAMFGYWTGIRVHLNHISESNRPNPSKALMSLAKELRGYENDRTE